MQSSSVDQINCVKACMSNMTKEELDIVTDNLNNTLSNEKGNELFASFVAPYKDSSDILNLYNFCNYSIICSKHRNEEQTEEQAEEQNQLNEKQSTSEEQLKNLSTQVEKAWNIAKECRFNSIRGHDLMVQFKKALQENTKEALVKVLQVTKKECQDSLRDMHEYFKKDIVQYRNTLT